MKSYYQDNHITIYNKDCRDMSELADNSTQCVVTSPPYWGLRKYSGEQDLIWGGEKDCEHEWGEKKVTRRGHPGTKSTLVGTQTAELSKAVDTLGSTCVLCNAYRCGYGLEPTPEMYVQHTIEILREIRRVLRKDGAVFWNIGDSYSGSGRGADAKWQNDKLSAESLKIKPDWKMTTLKPKDLCLIPFRLAIAAQEDGWWVRSVIIWSKPNPMPESVTDRPTESHEYILMLTKSARYYWDQEAVRESAQDWGNRDRTNWSARINAPFYGQRPNMGGEKGNFAECGRNLRSVWEFPTRPYPEAHFAVFPEKLPELCIKAATPEEGCCVKCGAPWERITARENMKIRKTDWGEKAGNRTATAGTMLEPARVETLGWQPTCKCNADKVPSIVLDPFAGAGTTLWVAKKLNRQAIGYDLSMEYCDLALDRNRQQALNLASRGAQS